MSILDKTKWRQRHYDHMANDLAAFLRSKEVSSITFMYGATAIFPGAWESLAKALEDDDGGLHVVKNRLGAIRKRSAAFYDPTSNTINFRNFRPLWTRYSRGTAVHECVHAWQDYTPKHIDKYDAEAAAELARLWYHVNAGTKAKSKHAQGLLDIAAGIKARQEKLTYMTVVVNKDEKEALHAHAIEGWQSRIGKYRKDYEFDGWDG